MPGAIPAEMIANIRQPLSFIFLSLSYHVVYEFTSVCLKKTKKKHTNLSYALLFTDFLFLRFPLRYVPREICRFQ